MIRLQKFILPLIFIVSVFYAANIQWGARKWTGIIEADGKGYYAYLPAIFIYNDLNFSFFEDVEKKYPSPTYDYRVGIEGRKADKYFAGTAVAMLPFFAMAHSLSFVFGLPADGYSQLYPVMINIAGIFYFIVGLFYCRRILRLFGSSPKQVLVIIAGLAFGTNAFYYAVVEPAVSHIYSFAFISAFVYYMILLLRMPSGRRMLIVSALLAMIIMIRPVNAIVLLLVPFLARDWAEIRALMKFFASSGMTAFASFFILISGIILQSLLYYAETGHWWIDTYPGESFNFQDPHPIKFLLSYKKGLFLYTPLCFFSLLGFIALFRQSRRKFFLLLIFTLAVLYLLSSWWNWWYGGSFSQRVAVDFYVVLAILMSYSFKLLAARQWRMTFTTVIFFCIILCQLMIWQYRYFFIHWEKMDREHYWRVFMRFDLVKGENPNKDLLE